MESTTLYASPEPYPSIQVAAPNIAYAQLLAASLASARSELTAITQYTYFSWVLDTEWAQLCTVFRNIANVEMRHLDLLGRTITALGGNPMFRAFPYKRPAFWSSGVLQYQSHIEKVLHISIAGEQEAIDGYQHLSKLIQDQSVIDLLQRIIVDEEIHLHLFQQYLTTRQTKSKQLFDNDII